MMLRRTLGWLGLVAALHLGPLPNLAGAIALCPPSALQEVWSRRFADPADAQAKINDEFLRRFTGELSVLREADKKTIVFRVNPFWS